MSTIDTIKTLIDKAGKSFTGLSWTSGPDNVVAALKRGDTRRAAEPDSGLDVPNDGSMFFGGLRRRWEDLLRDCLAASAEEQDPAVMAELLDEALDLQRENAEYVRDCAVECREGYGNAALAALAEGDVDAAIADLEDAVALEREFGDAPAWKPALDAARAYAATPAEDEDDLTPAEVHALVGDGDPIETGDELTPDEVEALGEPVRIDRKASAIGYEAMDPDSLYIYSDGSVVACYPNSNHYYATMAEAREHYEFADPVPSGHDQAWDVYVGSQPVAEFIANGGDVNTYAACAPSCEGLTIDERETVAALLARHIAAQG